MKKILPLLLLLCVSAEGAFQGLPLATNSDWVIENTNNYMGQLYSGVVERCSISGISTLNIVENWLVFDHYVTNTVAWTNGTDTGIYTNVYPTNVTYTTTNQTGPFPYAAGDGNTYTAMPFVTHYFLAQLDSKIGALVDGYIAYNAATNPTVWHSQYYTNDYSYDSVNFRWTNSNVRIYPITGIPVETKANLFHHAGVGYVASAITNRFGIVTNGTAYWTRQPPMTNQWVLAESHYTGAWSYVEISQFQTRMYETNVYPVLKYIIGGTNAFSGSVNVTINGTMLNVTNQTTPASSEIVAISSTNETLTTKPWYNISSIAVSGSYNTNDTVSLYYNGSFAIYGDQPYTLYASDINERYEVIKRLKYTRSDPTALSDSGTNTYSGESVATNTLAQAVAAEQAVYGPDGGAVGFNSGYSGKWRYDPSLAGSKDYKAYGARSATVTNIYANIATNKHPYSYQYYGFNLEGWYGTRITDATAPDGRQRYEVKDLDGIALGDAVDGNKFTRYHAATNATGTNISWNAKYPTFLVNLSNDPMDESAPTLDAGYYSDQYFLLFNVFPTALNIDNDGTTADNSGWFYIEHHFDFE